METSLFNNTPTILVQDNRGQTVRQIQYLRHPNMPDKSDELITRYQYNALGFLAHSIDPRLYEQQQTDNTVKPNFSYLTSLSGEVLSLESVDAGKTVTMKDIAQRPHFALMRPRADVTGSMKITVHSGGHWQLRSRKQSQRSISQNVLSGPLTHRPRKYRI